MKKLTTKIIAGKYKGKILELPALDTTRSTKAILKESFFNVLQYDIIDTVFVEAFGGSGSIGLEALSRGAGKSYFCEIDKRSYNTLVKNCKSVDEANSTTLFGDTFEVIPSLVNKTLKNSNDGIIVYVDPPFDFRDGMDDIYDKAFEMVKSFDNKQVFLVTFEHKSDLVMPEVLGNYQKFKTKKFGNSSLTYYN
jgi:16S rRNA (guanine(966)-N(2))-methyltransferase RsmD